MQKHNAAFLAALMCVVHSARAQSTPRSAVRIPVAARDLMRGTILSSNDIKWSDTTLTDGSIPEAASVAPGWVARRVIHAGEILREPGVAKPDLVSAGDAVEVIYSTPGVMIRVRGTAIGRGSKGDEVYVKLDNRRRLHGVIAGPNTVRVM
ncbi:MAG TPA: flagellar basal body P-ring formation chaperone FlgA [Gemmatimonadaceae bacterium]|jgi:flagella basal body P-ring formation protein FlgA